jgi:putative addiction module killer protein
MRIIYSVQFSRWLDAIAGSTDKARVLRRLERIRESDELGDWSSAGDGVNELRFHFGSGYRIYFLRDGKEFIVLLVGGNKGSQARDIKKARQLAKEYMNGN